MLSESDVCMDQGTGAEVSITSPLSEMSGSSLTRFSVSLKRGAVWFGFFADVRWPSVQRQPSVSMHTSSSRCCFCQFDSITVIIMGVTAPDNYYFFHI